MDGIIDECSSYSASSLVEITHKQDPWRDAYLIYMGNVITTRSIKNILRRNNMPVIVVNLLKKMKMRKGIFMIGLGCNRNIVFKFL